MGAARLLLGRGATGTQSVGSDGKRPAAAAGGSSAQRKYTETDFYFMKEQYQAQHSIRRKHRWGYIGRVDQSGKMIPRDCHPLLQIPKNRAAHRRCRLEQ